MQLNEEFIVLFIEIVNSFSRDDHLTVHFLHILEQ